MFNTAKRVLSGLIIGLFIAFAGFTFSAMLLPITDLNTVQGAEETCKNDVCKLEMGFKFSFGEPGWGIVDMWCEHQENSDSGCDVDYHGFLDTYTCDMPQC